MRGVVAVVQLVFAASGVFSYLFSSSAAEPAASWVRTKVLEDVPIWGTETGFASETSEVRKLTAVETGAAPLSVKLRILFAFPKASFVYQQFALVEALARRGHDVVVLTIDELVDRAKAAGAEAVSVGSAPDIDWMRKKDVKPTAFSFAIVFYGLMCEHLLAGREKLLAGERLNDRNVSSDALGIVERPDIFVISAPWLFEIRHFAERHEIPHVVLSPVPLFAPYFSSWPYLPLWESAIAYGGKSAWDRLKVLAGIVKVRVINHWLGVDEPLVDSLNSVKQDVLQILLTVPGLDYPQHTSQLIQFTGPLVSPWRVSEVRLPAAVSQHLENPPMGRPVVYVSMGSSGIESNERVKALVEGLKEGPWTVVWALKVPLENLDQGVRDTIEKEKSSGRLTVEPWLDSPAVLGHPNVKVFVSHCGSNGLHESLQLGTPLICLPMFGDQPDNCARLGESGAGVCVPKMEVSASSLRSAVTRVFASYGDVKRRAGVISATMKGLGGVTRASDLVEMAAAVKGDFSSWATVVEREGVVRSFCLDFLLGAVAMTVCSAILGGYVLGIYGIGYATWMRAKTKDN